MKIPVVAPIPALARSTRAESPWARLFAGALLGSLPLALGAAAPAEPSFPAPTSIRWADQGWNAAERERWHHRSAGQAFGPLSWVQSVEQPGNERRLMERDNLREFGFLPKEASFENPWALPVGFVRTAGAPGQRLQVGLTCAACHTGQVERGGRALRIDGAPAGFDLIRYFGDFYAGLEATLADAAKWERFVRRVAALEPGTGDTLRSEVEGFLRQSAAVTAASAGAPGVPCEAGHGRLDPFNSIGNTVLATELREPRNYHASNGPVSIPYMWDVPRLNWVHHNASFTQAMSRNILQILGNGGRVNFLSADGAPVPEPAKWDSNIDVRALQDLEAGFIKLRPPTWPADLLGPYDAGKARAGRAIFQRKCSACHAPRPIEGTEGGYVEYAVTTVPIAIIGTDPNEAETFVRRRYQVERLLGAGTAPIGGAEGLQLITASIANRVYDRLGYGESERRAADGRGRRNLVRAVAAYKARPLDGVWATAPFLHNGSVPNLYELLSPPEERSRAFWLGTYEYDPVRLGYVSKETSRGTRFDTSRPGNANVGHAFTDDPKAPGRLGPALTPDERLALVEYLKALAEMPPDPLPAVPFDWEKYPDQLGWRWPAKR